MQEEGTTEFAGALLRFYAAEGVVQGQRVLVVGVGEGWGGELPGVVGGEEVGMGRGMAGGMRIAWRYERLGEVGVRGGVHWGLFLGDGVV